MDRQKRGGREQLVKASLSENSGGSHCATCNGQVFYPAGATLVPPISTKFNFTLKVKEIFCYLSCSESQ